MAFILTVLGVVLIIEGIPYFAFPARAKHWAALMQEVPEATLRIVGVISILIGLLLFAIMTLTGVR